MPRSSPDVEDLSFYGNERPTELPFYTQWEVATAARVPVGTLREWLRPLRRSSGHGRDYDRALIEGPEGADGRLSFSNLTEAYVLAELRAKAWVSARGMRRALWTLRSMGIERPFLHAERLRAHGSLYYSEAPGEPLINATGLGQIAFEEILEGYLQRVELHDGRPVRLFPWIPNVARRSVVIDPRIRFGQPVMAGTGIRTATIRNQFEAGEEPDRIADGYEVDPELVRHAILYEAVSADIERAWRGRAAA